ncbi:DUF7344 domain-containing protein [Halosimplex salinum]|uniref:DUF7344 domain-containing protein n=1 Tax=Halosimplex salinum TaxID=1710538 RepID=UPI000F472FAF|nr:ArsR family transcriptional regulator [Halosimplex salinum]
MDSRREEILSLLTEEINRTIVSIVQQGDGEWTVTDLAERIVSEDAAVVPTADYEQRLEDLLITLHHERLPQLDDAGLIMYDRDENVVAGGAYTAADVLWKDIDEIDGLLSEFLTGHDVDDQRIGLIHGQEAIYDYSRELADRADEELFLIYTSDELLDEECLPHAKNAIERGVDFSAGVKSEDARQFFVECLPDATVWEPQLDWMHSEVTYPTVSRLIIADREKVVVGLWNDIDDDGTRTEVAMIGEGATNPLVVLVRELLGPRLDHLDYQSEDFVSDLPFKA